MCDLIGCKGWISEHKVTDQKDHQSCTVECAHELGDLSAGNACSIYRNVLRMQILKVDVSVYHINKSVICNMLSKMHVTATAAL